MTTTSRYLEAPRRLRAFVRAHETSLVMLAALIGTIGGLVVAAMGAAVPGASRAAVRHSVSASGFRSSPASSRCAPCWSRAIGGLLLGGPSCCCCAGGRRARSTRSRPMRCMAGECRFAAASSWRCRRSGRAASARRSDWRPAIPSLPAASAPRSGRAFHLRRADQRIMVGCGAAAAIAGAFGAPLAGAFYAFELVIGGYTPASLTPVGVAAVVGYFVAHGFAVLSLGVGGGPVGDVLGHDLAIAALLGVFAALFGIAHHARRALCENAADDDGNLAAAPAGARRPRASACWRC